MRFGESASVEFKMGWACLGFILVTQADKAVYIYCARIAFWQDRVLLSHLSDLGG